MQTKALDNQVSKNTACKPKHWITLCLRILHETKALDNLVSMKSKLDSILNILVSKSAASTILDKHATRMFQTLWWNKKDIFNANFIVLSPIFNRIEKQRRDNIIRIQKFRILCHQTLLMFKYLNSMHFSHFRAVQIN